MAVMSPRKLLSVLLLLLLYTCYCYHCCYCFHSYCHCCCCSLCLLLLNKQPQSQTCNVIAMVAKLHWKARLYNNYTLACPNVADSSWMNDKGAFFSCCCFSYNYQFAIAPVVIVLCSLMMDGVDVADGSMRSVDTEQ